MAEPITASIHIEAPPERVFPFFTEPDAMLLWMGEFAVLDARPGGEFTVDIRGAPIRGRYLEVDPPQRLLISWGHAGSESFPPGASTVEVRLTPHEGGTRVEVCHRDLPDPEREAYPRGWRHFLERLASAAAAAPGSGAPSGRARAARGPR